VIILFDIVDDMSDIRITNKGDTDMMSTYAKDVDPTVKQDYSIACWAGEWIVYKRYERRWPVAAGMATSEEAETWVKAARAADALRADNVARRLF